jgi:hypothetical protein
VPRLLADALLQQTTVQPVVDEIAFTVKGSAAGLTTNLTEWQNQAGTVLARVNQAGQLAAPSVFAGMSNYGANLSVATGGAGNVGAVIRGAASQSANLQEWQNSGTTALLAVSSVGQLRGVFSGSSSGAWDFRVSGDTTGRFTSDTSGIMEWGTGAATRDTNLYRTAANQLQTDDTFSAAQFSLNRAQGATGTSPVYINPIDSASAVTVVVVRGTSQTGHLTEWRDESANVLARINVNGMPEIYPRAAALGVQIVAQSGSAGWYPLVVTGYDYGPMFQKSQAGGGPSFVVKAVAAQSTNLQEWQNSSGTALAAVSQAGVFTFASAQFAAAGNSVPGDTAAAGSAATVARSDHVHGRLADIDAMVWMGSF